MSSVAEWLIESEWSPSVVVDDDCGFKDSVRRLVPH